MWRVHMVARDTAVGHVRRAGPVDGLGGDAEHLRDGPSVALIVDGVGRRQRAIDGEDRELPQANG
jgi:hypothetical protein